MAGKLKDIVKEAVKEAGMDEASLENEGVPDIDAEDLKNYADSFREQMAQQSPSGPGIVIHWSVLLAAFIILFSIIGLFSYRLYKSLRDKERKREEKKKLKELKKKK